MAVVIRLLGLRITAGSEDIRKFFSGLKIPDGGVHIIGGERGEAFIIFASDEDARRAMTRSGGCIKGSPLNLLLSSKSEMQNILEASTKNTVHNKQQQHEEFRRREKEGTDPSFNQNLAMEKRRPRHLEMGNRFVQDQYGEACLLNRKPESNGVDDLYLMLKGMPFSVTEDEVRKFFQGLAVDDVILMKNHRGQNNGKGFVKFRTRKDAREGIKRDREYIGSRFVEVYPATEREWMEAGGAMAGNVDGFNQTFRKGSLPPYRHRYPQERARSRSPLNYKSAPSSDEKFCVFIENLPYSVQKREVRELFRHASLKEDQILYLLDSEGKRTRSMFVLFRSLTDYCAALTHHKKDFLNRCLYISPISKEKMISFLEMNKRTTDDLPERHSMSQERQPLSFSDPYDSEKGRFHLNNLVSYKSASPSDEEFCVLLENLSYSVQKRDVKDLFRHASLNDDQILYLLDSEGKQTRSLFVLFRTLTDYSAALTHHKKDFLNRCLYISPISKEKMISILETNKHTTGKLSEKHSISQESQPLSHSDPYDSEKVCLYVRNLPFDVRKVEIMDFFLGFSISEDSVILLRDNRGSGLGEALVIFQTEREAMTAQSLNGQRFLGSELILKCISRFQMCKFGVAEHAVEAQRERVIGSEKYASRDSDVPLHSHDMECFDYLTPDGYAPPTDLQVHIHGGSSLYSNTLSPHGPQDSGNGSLHGGFGPPAQHSDTPTCLKLVNLPLQITIDEIYDFCYGYRVIPGSVSLQYNRNGVPKGSATVVFESRQEALTAVEELSGRPIGTRKIQLLFV